MDAASGEQKESVQRLKNAKRDASTAAERARAGTEALDKVKSELDRFENAIKIMLEA